MDCPERGRLQKNNSSGCTGVQARGDKWIAVITFKKKVHYLGIFETKEEAIRVRKEAESTISAPSWRNTTPTRRSRKPAANSQGRK